MPYWIFAFAAALLVVIGFAAGLVGAIIAVIAFAATLFLFWASTLGFLGAWTKFGLDRFTAPWLDADNRDRFMAIFNDREKVAKAITVAVVLIALSLVLPAYQVGAAVAVVVLWYGWQIRQATRPTVKTTSTTLDLTPVTEKVANDKVVVAAAEKTATARVN